jgi:hypothetical protein
MPKPSAAPKPVTPKAKTPRPPDDWPALLRSGPEGVGKWNKLTRARRRAVDLAGADLSGCDLTGVNLVEVSTGLARFEGSTLAEAKLLGTRAEGANFDRAVLRGADLSQADFCKASFAGADLTGADLSGSSLQGADFTGAVLNDTTLDGALFDKNTKWPAGFTLSGELTWAGTGTDPRLSGRGQKAVATDVHGLIARLNQTIDPRRMKRTLDMLKSGKNQLFAEVAADHVRGIVRSQREEDLVYSCVLTDSGAYACCTPDLSLCMGLRGEPCKHILVLVIGLVRAGLVDAGTVDGWVKVAAKQNHKWNKKTRDHVSDTLLRYKGAEAGEVDWRPTETLPEDYYSL